MPAVIVFRLPDSLYVCRMVIQANGIKKSYGSLQILKGVDLEIERGEIVSIVGKSGSGKSTLLHILGALDEADSGTIIVSDHLMMSKGAEARSLKSDLKNTNQRVIEQSALPAFRNRHIGFVFQFHHLLPEFTALENVCIPAFIAQVSPEEARSKAEALLHELGLADRMHHKPAQMSGGEQQRVAVARALINQPDVIFADEPTGNLDSSASRDFLQLIRRLRDEKRQTFVIVTHNQELADLSDRCLIMDDGLLSPR